MLEEALSEIRTFVEQHPTPEILSYSGCTEQKTLASAADVYFALNTPRVALKWPTRRVQYAGPPLLAYYIECTGETEGSNIYILPMKSETLLQAAQLKQFLEIDNHLDSLLSELNTGPTELTSRKARAAVDIGAKQHYICIIERDGTTLFQRVGIGLIEEGEEWNGISTDQEFV